MPTSKSVLKRERQNLVHRSRNRILKSKLHTSYVRLIEALNSKDKEAVEAKLRIYMSNVDKAVKKNIIQRNNAARKKSRMVKRIKDTLAS
jgi:small subunit ribosomal protein S20